MNIEQWAINELERVKAAVRQHHDQKGDDRCHLDDYKLYYEVLGEGTDPYVGVLPPTVDYGRVMSRCLVIAY